MAAATVDAAAGRIAELRMEGNELRFILNSNLIFFFEIDKINSFCGEKSLYLPQIMR